MLKKFIIFFLFLFLLIGAGIFQYKSLINEKLKKDNYSNFIQENYSDIKNYPNQNYFVNVILLSNKKISEESINDIINNSKSDLVHDNAVLIKTKNLIEKNKNKEALRNISKIRSDIFKPFFHLLRGDILKNLNDNTLAYNEYALSYDLFQDYYYKIILLDKIEEIKKII